MFMSFIIYLLITYYLISQIYYALVM